MLDTFQDKVAVITGAGSGFGREFALLGARRGMRLVLADIQPDALEQTMSMVVALGADAIAVPTDVGDGAAMDALRNACVDRFGVPDLLFNNAGVAAGGLIWENGIKDWEWVLRVNLWGVIHGVRAFVPAMVGRGQAAHIVNTASVAGLLSAPNMGVYNVSKHAVVALSETLFHDLRLVGSPVGVSVLCPAFVPTGIADSERNRPPALGQDTPPTESMNQAAQLNRKAVSSGRISAAEVAATTFAAIERDQFYIITHERIMESVRLRTDDVANKRNPTDPFSLRKDVAPNAGR
ncbi:MAG: SDR family oxidoreductase [Burkholderiaceae bacterium]